MKAIWKDTEIAQSDQTVVIEGNHYFPADSVNSKFLQKSDTTTMCPWKGTANYYSVTVDGEVNRDAAWFYAEPKDAAAEIRGRVAFWKGVQVVD